MNPSADPQFATALEGNFVGNCGKQPQWDVVEESIVPEVCLLQLLRGNTRWALGAFYFVIRRPKLENHASEGLIYLYTTWSRVLLEKLTGLQLVKKFPTFYGTRKFITAFTSTRHLSLPWASWSQSIPHIQLPEDPS